jgi:hypothetical protein
MAAGEFRSGHESKVMIGALELPSRSWQMNITGGVKNVSNTRDGRKRIPGLEDATGSFEIPYDAGIALPKANAIGVGKFYVDKADDLFYELNIIVEGVTPGMNFEQELVYNVAFSLESGTITHPAVAA